MSFDRYAQEYSKRAIVQYEVAKHISRTINNATTILDLGSGSGALYKAFNSCSIRFTCVDKSKQMLDIHPNAHNISLIQGDFDSDNFWNNIENFDYIVSCGALQWSNNIENVLNKINSHTKKFALAIFTHGTFESIRNITKAETFLPTSTNLTQIANKIFLNPQCETKKYRLYFSNKKDMFDHLKLTGVHFGKRLEYKEAKKLLSYYALDYLEFEVWFCKNK